MRQRFRLPALALVALLQRTPALRVVAVAENLFSSTPAAAILKSAVALASLGAVNSLAGATVVVPTRSSPISATVGTAIQSVTFGVTGSGVGVPGVWVLSGTVAPGLTVGGRSSPGNISAGFPSLSGTPTAAGSFTFGLQAWEFSNKTGGSTPILSYTVTVTGAPTAPSITTQPTDVVAGAGASVTFTAAAANATSLQWKLDGVSITGATGSTLTVTASEANAGAYSVTATGSGLSTTSTAANLTVLTLPPRSVDVHEGAVLALDAVVANPGSATFQWLKNGVAISGATDPELVIGSATQADAGSYVLRVTNGAGTVTSTAAIVGVSGTTSSRLSNMSVRTNLASGGLLTVGFVTDGNKNMLVRAVGSGLVSIFPQFFTLAQVFSDPRIALFQGQTVVQSNDDWPTSLSTEFSRLGGFPLVNGSKDAALERTISGPHTAQVNGTGSGVLLVEVYDADSGGTSKLKNVSARNIVGTGADILIAGFVIDGPVGKTLLIRGNGPFLFDFFGIGNRITDPKLEIYTGAGQKIAENDDWSASLIPYFNQVGAGTPALGSKDSALLITLPPGSYTAQLSGVNAVTGDGVVEVYEVE